MKLVESRSRRLKSSLGSEGSANFENEGQCAASKCLGHSTGFLVIDLSPRPDSPYHGAILCSIDILILYFRLWCYLWFPWYAPLVFHSLIFLVDIVWVLLTGASAEAKSNHEENRVTSFVPAALTIDTDVGGPFRVFSLQSVMYLLACTQIFGAQHTRSLLPLSSSAFSLSFLSSSHLR